MVDNAEVIARTTTLPVIADADTGYGSELNVTRTVRDFERSGVAGIHIEDQVAPKRCGHLDGKEVIAPDEFVSRIRAAVAARANPDFLIIARTDARAVTEIEDAIDRARAAIAVGADMAFVEAVQTVEELAAVPRLVGAPCLLNVVPGGKTPVVSHADAQAMGYKVAILPGAALGVVVPALDAALRRLKDVGPPVPTGTPASDIRETFRRFGSSEWDALRREHADAAA